MTSVKKHHRRQCGTATVATDPDGTKRKLWSYSLSLKAWARKVRQNAKDMPISLDRWMSHKGI